MSGVLSVVRDLARSEQGATALLTAMVATTVVGAMLTAFDIARLHLTQTRLQLSVDAAALAATRDATSPTLDGDVRAVFDANFRPGFLGTVVADFAVLPLVQDDATVSMQIKAEVDLPSVLSPMLSIVASDLFYLEASATTLRRTLGVELALVLDNTGSMRGGNKIGALRDAAQLLTDIVFDGRESVPNLQVAVVPYTATVNIGDQHAFWLADPATAPLIPPASMADFAPTDWKGCVLARTGGEDSTETPPGVAPLDPFFYPASDPAVCTPFPKKQRRLNCWPDGAGQVDERNGAQNDGYGPNLGCGPPILPLTESYDAVTATIAGMQPWHRGGTMANMGLVWGWRALSPDWRGLWRRPNGTAITDRPFDYDHPSTRKVVVLMTDGNNEWYQDDYTAYRFPADDVLGIGGGKRTVEINARMLAACTALKTNGVVVFTVTFGSAPSGATQKLYRDCASAPDQDPAFPGLKYFHAPTAAALSASFSDIAGQLTELRLIQ